MVSGSPGVKFTLLWLLLCLAKLCLALALPLMADEAFYAWEGRRLAWAYSDLPGLTAWLARLGMEIGGQHPLALRLPFLVLGACLPWLIFRISARWFGAACGRTAGVLAMLMPLSGMLGLLAVPDVPLVLASLVCLDAIARLRERVTGSALCWLALGLVAGALSHYRFGWVLLAGLTGVVLDARARRLFADRRFLAVLAVGVIAWAPLLIWNLENAGVGLRFQLLERHPWAWDIAGLWWLPTQALLVTPVLFVLLLLAMRETWRRAGREPDGPWRLLLGVGGLAVWSCFVLAFFADRERVSFHWPLAGWLLWLLVVPLVLQVWPRWLRMATLASVASGLSAALALMVITSSPTLRRASAGDSWYPDAFAGSQEIVAEVRRRSLPTGSLLVADNFALAAQLALALPQYDIRVLEHPLNHKHGRARQLDLWGRRIDGVDGLDGRPALLVVADSAIEPGQRLQAYQALCRRFPGLPRAEIVNVDHGRRRYFLFGIDLESSLRACTLPALAWIDAPEKSSTLRGAIEIRGWAFKEGAGIARVEILLDGVPVAEATYGLAAPQVAGFWTSSRDPMHPRVGFRARLDSGGLEPGRHWLGLRLHGRDGSIEEAREQVFVLQR